MWGHNMFGCGKFDEIKILNFLDGNKDNEVEIHLKECEICLKEVLELNRVNAEIEYFSQAIPQQIKSITLKSVRNKITSFFSNLSNPQIIEVGVRKEDDTRKNQFEARLDSFNIKISPQENDTFWVIISGNGKVFSVELFRKDDSIPVFSKFNTKEDVTIKNIGAGCYRLKINQEEIAMVLDRCV